MQTWWAYGIVKNGFVIWSNQQRERLPDEWVAIVLRDIRGSGMGLVIMESAFFFEGMPILYEDIP